MTHVCSSNKLKIVAPEDVPPSMRNTTETNMDEISRFRTIACPASDSDEDSIDAADLDGVEVHDTYDTNGDEEAVANDVELNEVEREEHCETEAETNADTETLTYFEKLQAARDSIKAMIGEQSTKRKGSQLITWTVVEQQVGEAPQRDEK